MKFANARSNGEFAVIEHQDPHALIVIDKDGSILIHGISNLEAASLIAKEILLRIGLSEKGLALESGEVLASFSIGGLFLSAWQLNDLRMQSTILDWMPFGYPQRGTIMYSSFIQQWEGASDGAEFS